MVKLLLDVNKKALESSQLYLLAMEILFQEDGQRGWRGDICRFYFEHIEIAKHIICDCVAICRHRHRYLEQC